MKNTIRKATVKKGDTIKLIGQSGHITISTGDKVKIEQIGGWMDYLINPQTVKGKTMLPDDMAIVSEIYNGCQTFNKFLINVKQLEMD